MKIFFLLFCSALLNFISWNYLGILFIINIAILFYLSDLAQNKNIFFKCLIVLLYFMLFNISVVFWIFDSSNISSICAFFANTLFLSFFAIPLFLLKSELKFKVFIPFWVFGEYLLTKWDLAFSWLNFGHVLGNQYYLIDWYSYLGVYGGSFWLLITAYIFYRIYKAKDSKNIFFLSLLFLLPLFSLYKFHFHKNYTENNQTINILCYIPKKPTSNYYRTKELYKFFYSNNKYDVVLTPELFYTDILPMHTKNTEYSSIFNKLTQLNNGTKFIFGADFISNNEKFNGLCLVNKDNVFIRTKKKYVPVTEYTTKYLEPVFGKSYYKKKHKDDTEIIKELVNTQPLVCYESIFSIFTSLNSDKYIIVMSSEAFMNKSHYGHNQYLNIMRVRAIENKKFLLKVSYEGISCVITPEGKIQQYMDDEFNSVFVPQIEKKSFYNKILTQFL